MMAKAAVWLIRLYQKGISPFLGANCRFLPTCSEYAIVALQRHGFCKGMALAIWRVLRCNPWGGHGYDPVPPVQDWRAPFRKKRAADAAFAEALSAAEADTAAEAPVSDTAGPADADSR